MVMQKNIACTYAYMAVRATAAATAYEDAMLPMCSFIAFLGEFLEIEK